MGKKLYFILMADVIDSRKADQQLLMTDFKEIVRVGNKSRKLLLLSPLTITLGDEFQGIANSLSSAINVILQLEEAIIAFEKNIKLRYVVMQGEIDTPINPKIAYEMLGPGLTQARETLLELKNNRQRFHFHLRDAALSSALNNAFIPYQGIVDDWNPERDFSLVHSFLRYGDYKKVAEMLDKERSLMWKRERSLKIDEYLAMKTVITYLGGK